MMKNFRALFRKAMCILHEQNASDIERSSMLKKAPFLQGKKWAEIFQQWNAEIPLQLKENARKAFP